MLNLENFSEISEKWSDYLINSNGDCYSKKSNRLLTRQINSSGYLYYTFTINYKRKNYLVHRLVAYVYHLIDDLDSTLDIDHIDRDVTNCELSNLQALTRQEHNLKTFKENGKSPLSTICPKCGGKKSPKATICRECTKKDGTEHITKQQIEELVKNFSWVHAGKVLGLSDNGLRKRYKSLGGNPVDLKRTN